MVYSTVGVYEDDFRFLIYTKLFNSLDHINMETKRSCKLTASLCLLVNLLSKKSLLKIKT